MPKNSKVPCFCKACKRDFRFEYNFVKRSTRNTHEKNDKTAMTRRLVYCQSNGIPMEGIYTK